MTCRNPEKKRYVTEAVAWSVIGRMRRQGVANSDVRPYKCDDHWHVGHSVVHLSQRIRKALRKR